MFSQNREASYRPLAQLETDAKDDWSADQRPSQRQYRPRWLRASLVLLGPMAVMAVAGWAVFRTSRTSSTPPQGPAASEASAACAHPAVRREWRSLQVAERQQYIDAVLCLMEKPSAEWPETLRFDDFSYAHTFEGTGSHYAAAFLPWHRYFIHAYETALREECHYEGHLVYWDWSLDAQDLAASPVWDLSVGFGGDGHGREEDDDEKKGEEEDDSSGVKGLCVTDGPFANTTRHWKSEPSEQGQDIVAGPHCLRRGFETGEYKDRLQKKITPEFVEQVLQQATYETFFRKLENTAHNSIPQFVRGDFYLATAPNDPVFFLHHTQVDRLWWLWQQQDPEHRVREYAGAGANVQISGNKEDSTASLDDAVSLGYLAEGVRVRDLMSTQSELLCYRYE